ncbi:sensor histidine kinase [Streptomyces gilvus]|uniref:sensor histidine kinase n=1 Tax=Streptomyces gilvus TaxID=2920937 RepID=UPI001F11401D|nr:histidine kinase [Streptomyces sp. CME 23]MCH5677706.1 histidine kinase [Streptomyces sp. CME 23]
MGGAVGTVRTGGTAGVAAEIAEWWRTRVSALRERSPLPRPSRWMWAADAILAFVLAACTVIAAHRQGGGTVFLPPVEVSAPSSVPTVPTAPTVPNAPFPPADLAQHLGTVQAWQLALAALTALPLVVRRRYPLTAFWAVTCVSLLFNQRLGGGDTTVYTFVSCVVAAYSAAVYSPYRGRALAGLVTGAALLALFHDENFPSFTPGVVPFLALLGVGLAANAVHTWKQRLRVLQENHETATRLAVDRERSRIARELHDVVTHNVSVMVIQAGAARKVMDTAPDRAREALLAVEAGGRSAMTELRQVMGLLTMAAEGAGLAGGGGSGLVGGGGGSGLVTGEGVGPVRGVGVGRVPGEEVGRVPREEGRPVTDAVVRSATGDGVGPVDGHDPGLTGDNDRDAAASYVADVGAADDAEPVTGCGGPGPLTQADLAPQPGLAQLPALTDRLRKTGVPIELTVTGTPVPLPSGVELAAYRVVQEGLTNAVKHAAGARVRVTVDHVPGALHIEVSDTGGTATALAGPGAGYGLMGLRERLAVHGGTLQTGERPTGGFTVRAVLPVEEPA